MDYILYLRASTQRQGQSGLGLKGQRLITHHFIQADDHILAEYIEVESGRKNDRPEMARAIAQAQAAGAVLLVAEMPRLARSVYFTSCLMEEKVRFKACALPYADEFTINIMASVAQKATKDISESTKRGLAAKNACGFQLGTPRNFTNATRLLGAQATRQRAQEHVANKQAHRMATLLRAGQPWPPLHLTSTHTGSALHEARHSTKAPCSGYSGRKQSQHRLMTCKV